MNVTLHLDGLVAAATAIIITVLGFLIQQRLKRRLERRTLRREIIALLVRYERVAYVVTSTHDGSAIPTLEKDDLLSLWREYNDAVGFPNEADAGRFAQRVHAMRDCIIGLQDVSASAPGAAESYERLATELRESAREARAALGDQRPLLDSRSLEEAVNAVTHVRFIGHVAASALLGGVIAFVMAASLLTRTFGPWAIVIAVPFGAAGAWFAVLGRTWTPLTLGQRLEQKRGRVVETIGMLLFVAVAMVPTSIALWGRTQSMVAMLPGPHAWLLTLSTLISLSVVSAVIAAWLLVAVRRVWNLDKGLREAREGSGDGVCRRQPGLPGVAGMDPCNCTGVWCAARRYRV